MNSTYYVIIHGRPAIFVGPFTKGELINFLNNKESDNHWGIGKYIEGQWIGTLPVNNDYLDGDQHITILKGKCVYPDTKISVSVVDVE
jgi:hypothetical protein